MANSQINPFGSVSPPFPCLSYHIFRRGLAKVKALLNLTNHEGSALHLAIRQGRSDVVQALCAARCDVNLQLEGQNGPLVWAAQLKELQAALKKAYRSYI